MVLPEAGKGGAMDYDQSSVTASLPGRILHADCPVVQRHCHCQEPSLLHASGWVGMIASPLSNLLFDSAAGAAQSMPERLWSRQMHEHARVYEQLPQQSQASQAHNFSAVLLCQLRAMQSNV